jgi:hypothetical protein
VGWEVTPPRKPPSKRPNVILLGIALGLALLLAIMLAQRYFVTEARGKPADPGSITAEDLNARNDE